ncbi:IS4 family transposase [Paenibacillus sp. MMS20-IR301]|uniref:IS4 family transposase n=1 Tax=Paenibacillus sp. MMS20-IR301 TaxID=2895946 RepID=UPI0028E760FD|nr:IS4 family transposase [Paenibacillus sp. MMS20-IR301]WNS43685.1 IS4 family transposase [Paenibacillus sp. MMS20-IR301]WNS44705.1 IS4 family transposase [Paenibacillus sp. MMS20-IR301]WNS45815.1 IS4 family transposase [Paenibacillus sp. MMS20-IR301]
MDNVKANSVIRQFLSLLPVNALDPTVFDYYTKKLTVMKSILIFVSAQLNRWGSYSEIEAQIRAQTELQRLFHLESISGSQLSRSLDRLPTELLEWLFQQLALRAKERTASLSGISKTIGKLSIVDASTISLPLNLGNWAQVTRKASSVKMHLRLVVASPDTVFPDAMVPTTANVGDRACAVELVIPSDTTYVMDRGYDDYKKMEAWSTQGIRFVMRLRDRAYTTVLEESTVPAGSRILRDAKVHMGRADRADKKTLRLIEFLDEKGRLYRLVTSIWEVSAEEIAQIYKNRWLIELFFKWMKQHLRAVHVHSYKPQAIWNQLFLVLITALLVQEANASFARKLTPWQLLKLMRVYLYLPWSALEQEVLRPRKSSKGKPTGVRPKPKILRTTVGKLRPSKK